MKKEKNVELNETKDSPQNKQQFIKTSLIGISIVLLIFCIYINKEKVNVDEKYNRLSQKYENIEKQLINANKEISNKNEEISELMQQDKQNDINNKIKELEDNLQKLETQKEELNNIIQTLEQEKQNLNSEIQDLKQQETRDYTTQNSTGTSSNNKQSNTSNQITKSVVVYITNTGKKYHRSGCSYLSKSKIEITLENAKARGYTPCSKCNP